MRLVAGPTIGGYLVDEISWSAVFWLHLPIVALTLVGLRIVPESRDPRNRPLDIPGALLATGALLAIVFAVIEGNETGWTSELILTSFATGGLLLAAFVRGDAVEVTTRERREVACRDDDSLGDRVLVRNRMAVVEDRCRLQILECGL